MSEKYTSSIGKWLLKKQKAIHLGEKDRWAVPSGLELPLQFSPPFERLLKSPASSYLKDSLLHKESAASTVLYFFSLHMDVIFAIL